MTGNGFRRFSTQLGIAFVGAAAAALVFTTVSYFRKPVDVAIWAPGPPPSEAIASFFLKADPIIKTSNLDRIEGDLITALEATDREHNYVLTTYRYSNVLGDYADSRGSELESGVRDWLEQFTVRRSHSEVFELLGDSETYFETGYVSLDAHRLSKASLGEIAKILKREELLLANEVLYNQRFSFSGFLTTVTSLALGVITLLIGRREDNP